MASKLHADTEEIERLRGWLPPGSTAYTVLRHVSRSGMVRDIGLIVMLPDDGGPVHPNYTAAAITGRRLAPNGDGIRCHGAGMDMGFDLVYSLSRALYPDGYLCIGADCPANDHSNPPYPERVAGSMHHPDGGYAVSHRWL